MYIEKLLKISCMNFKQTVFITGASRISVAVQKHKAELNACIIYPDKYLLTLIKSVFNILIPVLLTQ